MTPAFFVGLETLNSRRAKKHLGEGRSIKIDFDQHLEDGPSSGSILLTYSNARDLVIEIVKILGPTMEFRSMTMMDAVMTGLEDLQRHTDRCPSPSDN